MMAVFPRPDTSAAGSVWTAAPCEAAPRCIPAVAGTRVTRVVSRSAGDAGASGAPEGAGATRRLTTRSPSRGEQKIYISNAWNVINKNNI